MTSHIDFDRIDPDSLFLILEFAGGPAAASLSAASSGLAQRVRVGGEWAEGLWRALSRSKYGELAEATSDDGAGESEAKEPGSLNAASAGAAVSRELADVCTWFGYYRHRASLLWDTPPSPSPLGLIQEDFCGDAWRLLSACILCSRTSGSQTIRSTIASFHAKYRTPTDVVLADVGELRALLLPLGLNRERTLQRFAREFLVPWRNVVDMHGCGAFADASHKVFCRGEWRAILKEKNADKNVRAYAAYCARMKGEGNDGDSSCQKKSSKRKRPRTKKQKMGCSIQPVAKRRSRRISGQKAAHLLGATILFSALHVAAAEGWQKFELPTWEDWSGLIQYLLAMIFVILGLHFMLYSPLSTYGLMKQYLSRGESVPGEVLSCDPSRVKRARFELATHYRATFHKFAGNPRMKFRYPNAFEEGRFLRRFESEQELSRGCVVDVILLPGEPRSGLTLETVERTLKEHSHARTVLVLLPSLTLLGFILYGAVTEIGNMKEPIAGWAVLGMSAALTVFLARMWSESQWRDERRRRFWSAVPTKVVMNNHDGGSSSRTEPLLSSVEQQSVPVVVGREVTTIPIVAGRGVQ